MTEPVGFAEFPRFFDSGTVTNPSSLTVLVSGGPINTSRVFKVLVVCSTDTAGTIQVITLNSAGGNYRTATLILQPGIVEVAYLWYISTCEQVNVVVPSTITGHVAASLNIMQAASGPSIGFM